ncbi:MAG: hypothetical protein M3Z75_23910 [Actinomycetota bacterium]|nr:hypothetical protein [Actinomycetota bacterium]
MLRRGRARAAGGRGEIARTAHVYPAWSLAIQQAAAQLFGGYGERAARPARAGEQQP